MVEGRAVALLLVHIVMAVTLLEGGFLVLRHRLTGRGAPPGRVLPNLGAALCLLLGTRAALTGGGVWPIAACLAGSGICHALDLGRR